MSSVNGVLGYEGSAAAFWQNPNPASPKDPAPTSKSNSHSFFSTHSSPLLQAGLNSINPAFRWIVPGAVQVHQHKDLLTSILSRRAGQVAPTKTLIHYGSFRYLWTLPIIASIIQNVQQDSNSRFEIKWKHILTDTAIMGAMYGANVLANLLVTPWFRASGVALTSFAIPFAVSFLGSYLLTNWAHE